MSLGSIIAAVFELRASMREQGATEQAIAEATERSVRSAWPKTEREWKYLCHRCSDYGLEIFDCPGDATCGREKPHLPHDYGQPCWCSAGAKFRPKPRNDDDFQQAGKTPKPSKGFQKFGGR